MILNPIYNILQIIRINQDFFDKMCYWYHSATNVTFQLSPVVANVNVAHACWWKLMLADEHC